ncbi:hypothetical protein Dda_4969 [Drechslerella dactyloides]|uniref:Uncharacterized protein n=1 Tax=Drechslerella dactyloides TaxID=74499 RepID=A0AAD6NJV1_DREDA|nr:hypothetical protein Dda_4969 [Drechslerella dactyloides]
MDRISLSRASRAFHRSSKNLRDSTPPASPDRKALSRLSRASRHENQMKFQISAPVELLSSTSMISYTSQSLRNPSPTGRTASAIGYRPQHQGSRDMHLERAASPAGGRASPIPRAKTSLSHHHSHKKSLSNSFNQPPSPASTSSGGSSAGPLSPDIGAAISNVFTPPTTPPPESFNRISRSSSVGPKPLNPTRHSAGSNKSSNSNTSTTATTANNIANSNKHGSMDFQQRLQRIKSTSSLSSSISNASSGDNYNNYRLEYSNHYSHNSSGSSINEDYIVAKPTQDLRRTSSTLGPRTSYKPPARAEPRTSGLSRSSSNASTYNGSPPRAQQSPPAAAPPPVMVAPSPMPPPPPRVSARRSASNPNLRTGAKRAVNKANPFAHELAQVSELAEDMGLDLVDNDVMIRKGLLRFSAKDYLAVIRDVTLFPAVEEEEPLLPPVVPIRRKPSIFRTAEKFMTTPTPAVYAPPKPVAPPVVAGQPVTVGGWI